MAHGSHRTQEGRSVSTDSNGGTEFLLSLEERERFASWLEREAATDDQLIEQMEKAGVPRTFVVAREVDAQAKRRIAHILRSTDAVSL